MSGRKARLYKTLALVGSVVKNKGKPVRAIGQGVIRWIKDEECDECICEVYRLQAKQEGNYALVARFTRRYVSLRTTQFQVGGIWLSCILNQVKSVHDILDFERIFQSKGITKKNGHFHLSTIWKQTKHIKECILFSSE